MFFCYFFIMLDFVIIFLYYNSKILWLKNKGNTTCIAKQKLSFINILMKQ